jgi:hypothetical protein
MRILYEVEAAAAANETAKSAQREAENDLYTKIRGAKRMGCSLSQISAASGLSRTRISQIANTEG